MERNFNTGARGFLESTGVFLFMNLLASALNYGYQILLARVLSVGAFGVMYVIFSLLMILAVPGNTFTMLAAKEVAVQLNRDCRQGAWAYIGDLTKKVTLLSCAVFFCGLAAYVPLKALLRMDDPLFMGLTVLACALGYYHPLFSGCLSGMRRFIFLGLYALMIPAYKLLGVAAALPFQAERIRMVILLLSIVLGSAATAVIGWRYLKRRLDVPREATAPEKAGYDQALWGNSFAINICFALYVNIDVIAAQHIGGESLSGIYSAVSLFGKVLYYCAVSVGTVLLPTAATAEAGKRAALLRRTLLAVSGVSAAGLLLANLLKRPLIQLIYGAKYLPAAEYMMAASLLSFSIALLTVLTNYFIGIARTRRIRNTLLVLVLWLAGVLLLAPNLKAALAAIGCGGLLCDLYLAAAYFRDVRRGAP